MPLVIGLLIGCVDAQQGVVGALAFVVVGEYPDQHRGAACGLGQGLQIGHLDAVQVGGNGRLRPHHQVAVEMLQGQAPIHCQRRLALLGQPLARLRHIALYQGHLQGPAPRLNPVDALQGEADARHRKQHEHGQRPVSWLQQQPGQQSGQQRQRPAGQQRTTQRQPAAQRGIWQGLAEQQPGEPAAQPPAYPFQQHPAGRPHQSHLPAPGRGKTALEQPGQERGEHRQQGHEARRQQAGDGGDGLAEEMDAVVHPGDTETVQPEPIAPAMTEGMARWRQGQDQEQKRKGHDGQRPQAERGVGQYLQGTGGDQQQACPPAMGRQPGGCGNGPLRRRFRQPRHRHRPPPSPGAPRAGCASPADRCGDCWRAAP